MNPGLVPRKRTCYLCTHVSAIEHVTAMLFDERGEVKTHKGRSQRKPAIDYLATIGITGSDPVMYRRLAAHVGHVTTPTPIVPAEIATGNVTPMLPDAPVEWFDVQRQGLVVGMDALRIVASRLEVMEDKDLISVARLGQTAATSRGALEAKGRSLRQVDSLLRLAAGIAPDG